MPPSPNQEAADSGGKEKRGKKRAAEGDGGGDAGKGDSKKRATGGGGTKKRATGARQTRRIEFRTRTIEQVATAMRMGDSSAAAGVCTPEVLVDPVTAARAIRLVNRNEAANTAVRVLVETMLGGNAEAQDRHGRPVEIPPAINDRIQEALRALMMDALRMMLVWGVVVFGVRCVPARDPRTGGHALTAKGFARMVPEFWVPQEHTFALTTWREGSRQRYNFYEYVPAPADDCGGGGGGGGDTRHARSPAAQAGTDTAAAAADAASTKRVVTLSEKYARTAYACMMGGGGGGAESGSVPGSFQLNSKVVILDNFRQQPSVLTGELTSRLASALTAFTRVESDDALALRWQEAILTGGYTIEELPATASKAADSMLAPPISLVPPAFVIDRLATEPPGGAAGEPEAPQDVGPTVRQLVRRAENMAAAAAATEIAQVRGQMLVHKELGPGGIEWARANVPSCGRWRLAPPGAHIASTPVPPEPHHLDEHHQMRLQEATATLGINRELIITPSGRHLLGHVAVVMDTQRQSIDFSRRFVNRVVDEALALARLYVTEMRAKQASRAVTRRALTQVVFEDFIDFDSFGNRKSPTRRAVRLAFPATSYTSSEQLRELRDLGVLSWKQFGGPMLRAAGMDTALFYDAAKRPDPAIAAAAAAAAGAGAAGAKKPRGGGGGGAASAAKPKATPQQTALHKESAAVAKPASAAAAADAPKKGAASA